MIEIVQRRDPLLHDAVARFAMHIDNEGNTTAVVFVGGVIEALRLGKVRQNRRPLESSRG